MDLLFTKYIKAEISYEGISRVEKYEYPKEAVREALLNAIVHKDYAGGTFVQIKVYPDKMTIWNEGQLPENRTIQTLLEAHSSKPYNPDIANALFRSGYIESWGRGTLKIIKDCKLAGNPIPNYHYSASGFWVEFRKSIYTESYLLSIGLNIRQIKAVFYVLEHKKITNGIYQELNSCTRNIANKDLSSLIKKNILKSNGQKGIGALYTL